jgi:hypothetical protein
MAVTLTKEFWTNLVLFVVACVALGLSIWAFATPCKKDKFGIDSSCGEMSCEEINQIYNNNLLAPVESEDAIIGFPYAINDKLQTQSTQNPFPDTRKITKSGIIILTDPMGNCTRNGCSLNPNIFTKEIIEKIVCAAKQSKAYKTTGTGLAVPKGAGIAKTEKDLQNAYSNLNEWEPIEIFP